MLLETRAVPPFLKNAYIVGCEDTRQAIVIDPGDEVHELLTALEHHQFEARYILLTHAHLDHITGVAVARRALDVPIYLHKDDLFLYESVVQQGMMFGIQVEKQPKPDRFYEAGQTLEFGSYQVAVHHTPGHCPGGVCLAVKHFRKPETALFVGDTLFAGSIGRTDLPGGDMETLLASIRNVLFAFPDETPVYSGHGPVTTIGREKRTNPFLTTSRA
jgi:glyoxylase-like metal-dependent hydrolase (beta-lactamase superfamily II)